MKSASSRHDHLAGNIRRLRRGAGLTQQKLAAIAGVPRATLASMEQGKGNPGLDNVIAVAEALNTALEDLLLPAPEARHFVVRAGDARPSSSLCGRYIGRQISPVASRGVLIQDVTLLPACDCEGRPHPPGSQEFFFVYAGEANLLINGQEVKLPAGSQVQFPGDLAHRYRNLATEEEVRAVSTIVMTLG